MRFVTCYPVRRRVFFRYFNVYRMYFNYNDRDFDIDIELIQHLQDNLFIYNFYTLYAQTKKLFKYFYIFFKYYVATSVIFTSYMCFFNDYRFIEELNYKFLDIYDAFYGI